MSIEAIDFRLEDVMDNLANLVGMKAEDKGLELLFDAAPDVPTALVGDPLRLGQVLINLGNNAVKFTEQGEIVVGVEKVARGRASGCRAALLGARHRHRHDARAVRAGCSSRSARPTPRPRASTAAPAWAWRSPRAWSS